MQRQPQDAIVGETQAGAGVIVVSGPYRGLRAQVLSVAGPLVTVQVEGRGEPVILPIASIGTAGRRPSSPAP